jgi:hypothetical protein
MGVDNGRALQIKLTDEIATQRLANSAFAVLLAALLQISGSRIGGGQSEPDESGVS